MATHSSVLAWRTPGAGSLVGCRLRSGAGRDWGQEEKGTVSGEAWRCKALPRPGRGEGLAAVDQRCCCAGVGGGSLAYSSTSSPALSEALRKE